MVAQSLLRLHSVRLTRGDLLNDRHEPVNGGVPVCVQAVVVGMLFQEAARATHRSPGVFHLRPGLADIQECLIEAFCYLLPPRAWVPRVHGSPFPSRCACMSLDADTSREGDGAGRIQL